MPAGVRDNTALSRFELDAGGSTAVANYRLAGNVMTFTHTEVAAAMQGQGIASKLVHEALLMACAKGFKVVPGCSFVSAYLARHPEFNDLVA